MSDLIKVQCIQLPHGADLPLPAYATPGAAGLDLMAALGPGQRQDLAPMARLAVPTGLAIALPDGFEAQVRPRSGLARRFGVTMVNAPGTVDSDYRGEIHVLLINLGEVQHTIEHGDRIGQLVIQPVARIGWQCVHELSTTGRGDAGFGSTGFGQKIDER